MARAPASSRRCVQRGASRRRNERKGSRARDRPTLPDGFVRAVGVFARDLPKNRTGSERIARNPARSQSRAARFARVLANFGGDISQVSYNANSLAWARRPARLS